MTDALHSPLFANDTAAPVPPRARVDFGRPVVSILGLPFDAIGLDEAVERIRRDAFSGRRCFVSTPNLNFAVAAHRDAVFRGSVLRSDLCLVDGMPLVWIAQLLRLPVHERVSGADVFNALQAHAGPSVSVFLFGGLPGAAAAACEGINRRGGGVRCVGFDAAGFGDIASMSSEAQIARINASGAQFVVVSLGAKKGQAWIEHNASRLTSPVLSHLGAVMNFAAGNLRRAPTWMQRTGLEWLWRIREEPALWHRYWRDGSSAVGLLVMRVVPDALTSRRLLRASMPLNRIEWLGSTLCLHGAWPDAVAAPLRAALSESAARAAPLTIELSDVVSMGPACVALLLIARGWFDAHGGLQLTGASARLSRALRRKMASQALLGTD